jgi:hypothetical protein
MKYYLSCLFLSILLSLSHGVLAQKKRTIKVFNNVISLASKNNSTALNKPNSCTVDTITLTTQTQINSFATTYPTCTTPKYLLINGEGASPAITSLSGLSSITQVINKLEIKNTSITSLSALNNITSIGDTLLLERNNLLTSIGLTNLTEIGAIYFSHLPQLNSVAGLCNNFHKTGLIYIDSTNLSNLTGLHTIDTLTASGGYPFQISYSPIVSLSALNNLKYIPGYFVLNNNNVQTSIGLTNIKDCYGFFFENLPLLNAVAGLTNNLTNGNIGSFWFINTGIPNLNGLEGLTGAYNFYLWGNNNLTSIAGLQNLTGNIDGGFSIWSNNLLSNIAALSGITNIDHGTIELSFNAITNVNGLKGITNIDKGLWIEGNNNLTNLDSLHPNLIIHNNIDAYSFTKDSLRIADNPLLAVCEANPICNYINGGNPSYITNNAVGCNDTAQIHTACLAVGIYNDVEDNCCINNAIVLNENVEKLGHVGQYDPVADDFVDQYDTYRIILPYAGAIKIIAEAKRDSCNTNHLSMELLDKQGTPFPSGYYNLLDFTGDPCNTTLLDTIRIVALEADTFYIRLQSLNQISYKIKYFITDSANSDVEPNSIIANATFLNPLETKKGHLNFKRLAYINYDVTDIYKAYVPNGGTIKAYFKTTYRGQTPLTFATYNDYNFTVNNNSSSLKAILPNGLTMSYGDEHYDTLQICAVIGDTVYFRIIGNTLEYEFKYEVINAGLPPNDVEPNNSYATAAPIAYNELKQGLVKAIGYNPTGDIDYEDYYKTYLPKNGKLKVILSGANISCNNTNQLTLEIKGSNGNSFGPTLQPAYTAGDTLVYCSLIADTAFFKITANYPISYSFKYIMTDTTIVNDVEPNNTIAQATPIAKGVTKKGTLSYKNNLLEDVNDYYKIIFTCPDTLKLTSIFTNQNCDLINNYYVGTGIQLYNKNGTLLQSKGMPNLSANQIYYDTTAFVVPTADTFYVNYKQAALGSNVASLSYEFTVKNTAPSGAFTITGADSSCISTKIYKAENVCGNGITYHWSLGSGGTLTAVDSIATVNWTTAGTHTISLYTSNIYGNSATKQYIVNVIPTIPLTAPVITANGRNLKTTTAPLGAGYQWYKTGIAIIGANDSTYFAVDSGTYTVRYKNFCTISNASNAIYFALPILNQTITFNPLTPDVAYAPNAFVITHATASSTLPVVYSIVSGNATMSLDSVKLTGAGTIIIAANQAGNINFYAAPTKYDTIQVTPGNQTITFPTIPNKKYSDTTFTLQATSSVGLPISYTVVSGNGYIYGNTVTMTGAGTVTIQATQTGNAGYNAAVPVSQSFCVGVGKLTPIQGFAEPCIGTYKYTTQKIVGANYIWTLSSGGTLTFNNDTATVVWNTLGTHTLTVKANSSCDATYSTIETLTVNPNNSLPTVVSNMLPANNAVDQQLPLDLSWIPGQYSNSYDIFIWRSDTLQPTTPFATNITTVNYTIPQGSLAYNKAYKWRVISKNPCNQIAGPIQLFTTIPLPDLQVLNLQAPLTAFTGQNITINWTVKNNGPSKTTTNQGWYDAVYLSYDSINPFSTTINASAAGWNVLNGTLLIGSKTNLTALDSGQQYTNTLNYTMPLNTTQQVYVYVITNYFNPILEVTKANDTIRSTQPIAITLSPTPDLRVDTVFASNTTFSGSTVNVTYKVKNYGANTPANSFWRDKFYISNSQLFNINNATELKAPKANDSYYYNPPNAEVDNGGILQKDSSVIKNTNVVIPNFIQGTYFIHVITNALANSGNQLYEGSAASNNSNYKQLQILMTPTPKLEIAGLNLSGSSFSSSQPINVNYGLINNGFFDNIERNKGHHILNRGICTIECHTVGVNGSYYTACTYGSAYADSISWGSSEWVDNVYISPDSTGLNSGNAILLSTVPHIDFTRNGGAVDLVNLNDCYSVAPFTSFNIYNVIKPSKIFPSSTAVPIPSNLAAGNYYIYVWANANKGVFEFPANNEIKRTGKITIGNPDLSIPTATASTTVYGGQPFAINYTVANNNANGLFNTYRMDKIYISNSPVYDTNAVLINATYHNENVLQNAPVAHTVNYSFPFTTTGTKYIFIRTNADSSIKETTLANNIITVPISILVTTPPASVICDLVVSNITMADTVFTKLPLQIQYTVPNNGLGTTQGTWTDSIFVSCSPTFNAATAKFVTSRQQTRAIASGASYTDVFNVTTDFANLVNACFLSTQQFNNAYFFVKANADNVVYEGANGNNNILSSGLKVFTNPWPDYVVTKVNSTVDTTIVGRPFPASWTVKNLKYAYTNNDYSDAIFFSPDSVFNNNAVYANYYKSESRFLNQNQSYSDSSVFATPNMPTGNYYVFAKTNYSGAILNENTTNNTNLIRNANGSVKKIHVIQLPLPDFIDSVTVAPTSIAIGQPLTIKAKITNQGLGANYPSTFSNRVWLNTSFNIGGYLLGSTNANITLHAGQSYTDSISIILPLNIPAGNYILVWHTNNTDNVFETNSNNNLAFKYITIVHPTPVDLVVDKINMPDTAYLGYPIHNFNWFVLNNSINAATGYSYDGVYLSQNNLLDSTATLLGMNLRNLNMAALKRDTINNEMVVNKVIEGKYNVLVKADVLNNIVETDKTNNVGIATKKLYVKVVELPLNILKPDSLSNTVYRYYKLKIPDSLRGATIQVSLKTNDSLTRTNQLYIGAGYVPDPAHFDYKYETPNYGNQSIVMTSVNDSLYYITVRNVNSAVLQNITLKAVKLPFTILNVQSNSGGNTGNVTVKISGNLFNNSMVAKLKLGATTINASAIYFTNSTTVYATFNLAAKPLGIYNVELFKTTDSTTAILPNGFSIVPANNGGLITGGGINGTPGDGNEPGCAPNAASGLNSQLSIEFVIAPFIFTAFPFQITINFTNPTNVDIPAQTKVVYADQGVVMANTQAGLATGTTSLYVTFTEPGGPPGIIRAGATGSLILYGKAPDSTPGHSKF